jgi:hypothetical protein
VTIAKRKGIGRRVADFFTRILGQKLGEAARGKEAEIGARGRNEIFRETK